MCRSRQLSSIIAPQPILALSDNKVPFIVAHLGFLPQRSQSHHRGLNRQIKIREITTECQKGLDLQYSHHTLSKAENLRCGENSRSDCEYKTQQIRSRSVQDSCLTDAHREMVMGVVPSYILKLVALQKAREVQRAILLHAVLEES